MNVQAEGQVLRSANRSAPWAVPGRSLSPLASLRLHRRFALLVTVLVLLVGIPVALIYGRHEYVAEAKVEVSPTFPSAVLAHSLGFNSDQEYRDFVEQQVAEIGSYETAHAALAQLGNDRWLWQGAGESDRMAAERLVKFIDVNPVPGTYLISVSLAGDRPEGLAQIVNAVVNAYLQRQRQRDLEQSDERVQLLTLHKADLEKDLGSLRTAENKQAQELGVSTFGAAYVSPYDKMLEEANTALDKARRATIEAQAHLDALNEDEERVKSLEVDSAAEQIIAADPQANDARGQLTKQREAVFLELQQLGPNHPGRPALQDEMRRIDDELARLTSAGVDKVKAMLRQNRETKARQEISTAQAQVDQANLSEKGIELEVNDLRARAAAFGSKYKQAVAIDTKVAAETAQIQQIDEQIGVLQAETQSPGFVSLESAAMIPDIPLQSKRRKIMTLFLLAGLLVATGLPTVLDAIDPLIKTPDELEAIVGFPPFGAALGNEGRTAREALRRIALGVIRECRVSGTRSFVLTPVSEGTASRRLAFAIADQINELGIRALAVESKDLTHGLALNECQTPSVRLPRARDRATRPLVTRVCINGHSQHAEKSASRRTTRLDPIVFSADRMSGGNGLIDTSSEMISPLLRAASRADDEPQIDGARDSRSSRPANEFEPALMPGPVRYFLDKVRKGYDIVLFDSPPILSSTDAEMFIQMPAGVILVVRSGHDVPRDVTSAMRRLERISPPVVGTVITYEPKVKANDDYSPQAIVRRSLAAR